MGIEYLLISIVAINLNMANSTFVNRFTTSTACEAAAQALRQGQSTVGQQERKYDCVKWDPTK